MVPQGALVSVESAGLIGKRRDTGDIRRGLQRADVDHFENGLNVQNPPLLVKSNHVFGNELVGPEKRLSH